VEWEAAQEPKYTISEFLSFPGANFVMVEGDVELVPGFRLVATPGHTPGHQVVAISTAKGVMVLAGQAIETLSELEGMLDSGDLRDDARKVMELEPVKVWFSHDHRVWERPHAAHG
jgi:N-acyl homoserine lactone hydrolase